MVRFSNSTALLVPSVCVTKEHMTAQQFVEHHFTGVPASQVDLPRYSTYLGATVPAGCRVQLFSCSYINVRSAGGIPLLLTRGGLLLLISLLGRFPRHASTTSLPSHGYAVPSLRQAPLFSLAPADTARLRRVYSVRRGMDIFSNLHYLRYLPADSWLA